MIEGSSEIAIPKSEISTKPKPSCFSVPMRRLVQGECRIDATFHGDEAVAARRMVEEAGFEIKLLGDRQVTSEVYKPPRFKRVYTTDSDKGRPYLNATEAFNLQARSDRMLLTSGLSVQADRFFAKAGNILVTRSGTVGRCRLVTDRLRPFFLSDDLLHVVPVLPSGYLYAFLNTRMGQILMARDKYGGTIKHLEPSHLRGLPVPLLPQDVQRTIDEQIAGVYGLRDEANGLLDKANALLCERLGLSPFDEPMIPYLGEPGEPRAFSVSVSEFRDRLDASFHLPVAKAAIQQMQSATYPLERLGELVERIFVAPVLDASMLIQITAYRSCRALMSL